MMRQVVQIAQVVQIVQVVQVSQNKRILSLYKEYYYCFPQKGGFYEKE
jgi:hypothetical protein